MQNEKGLAKSSEFLGFLNDFDATIDLGKSQQCSTVVVHALRQQASWIWQPSTVSVFSSEDGITFRTLGMTDDFEIAIAEGATHVRVGRAIFGERGHARTAVMP